MADSRPLPSPAQIDAVLEHFETHFEGLKSIGKVAFVFSGHGTEWVGMGRRLLATEPVFRQTVAACAEAHEASFPAGAERWNLLAELEKPEGDSRMDDSHVAHPCLVALEIGLVELLKSRGITPDAVVGHSVGEVAAAYCAGALDIPSAFRAVHYQTEVMDLVRGKGRMLFVAKPAAELKGLLDAHPGELSIAAVNSHGGAVLSGTEATLDGIRADMEAANVFARMLKMDIPFHSHTMIAHIGAAPSGYAVIEPGAPTLPFYSTVTGDRIDAPSFDGDYWARHISEPVRFAEAVDRMIADGCNAFLEIGPHTAHGKDLSDLLAGQGVAEYVIAPTLRRGEDDAVHLAASLAFAHTRGFPIETEGWSAEGLAAFEAVLAELTTRIAADQAAERTDPATLRALEPEARREALLGIVQRLVQKVGKVDAAKLADEDAGFMSLGINSIMSVQLKELLAKELDLSLPNTLIFDYPSQARLVAFLDAELAGTVSDGPIYANRAWKEVDDFAASLEGLSDAEAEALLEAEIGRIAAAEGLEGNKKLLYLLKQEQVRREPIAVVGMACRLPGGANDLESYWRLLAEGRDGTSEIPADRWNNAEFFDADKTVPGKSYVKRGGFLQDFDPYAFDPYFFKISPKEALGLDPQQRLLLEVAAEAFQDAGIPLDSLSGANCGSYVGICSDDYKGAHLYSGDLTKIDAYSLLGTALSAAGGRISFTWGLQGPAVSIDTACSSSLIATHMAVKGIRNGECDMAVVAGVNYLLNPVYFVYFSKLQAVSPDGVCKTFDASANGYSRGEGCGVLILKRLSMALEDNDRIVGMVRGSAINQDGASSGFTAPNGIAQQDLLQRALRDAGLKAEDIDYIETHGTGTPLGDPIEAGAVAAVYGEGHDKDSRPLIMGSVKSSIGHLEGAAGVSGILKILLSMQHGAIPANLHFHDPNPDIAWDRIPVVVPTSLTPWEPVSGKPRVAGVSGFGFSGSNAHVLFEQAPPREPARNARERTRHLLAVSAKDAGALTEFAGRYAAFLRAATDTPLGDIAYSSTVGRDHWNNRLTVVADTHEAMAEALEAAAAGDNDKRVKQGVIPGPRKAKVAFLFTGQGSQYFGMGRELYETSPLFRERLEACAAVLDPLLEAPLLDILYDADGDTERVNQTANTQPAIFAVEYALYGLWEAAGVKPHFVMGHSVGEYVAAVVSGLMTLEDGCRLIAERGRLMNALPEGGVMAAVFAPRERIEELIAPWEGRLNVAAHNSPSVNTVSGEAEALEEAMAAFQEAKVKARKLVVSHAFHSHLMDPMLEEFAAAAAKITFHEPRIPLISNVTCRPLRVEEATPDYWCQHVRGTVGFHDSMQTLRELGADAFIEVGADVTLSGLGKQCLPDHDALWVSSLKRKTDNWETLLGAVAELHVHGVPIDWKGFEGLYERRKVRLPLYPYQRKRFYLNPYNFPAEGFAAGGGGLSLAAGADAHPLLGDALPSPMGDRLFVQAWDLEHQGFVADHVIYGMPFVPGTAYLEMGLAAARDLFGDVPVALADVNLKEAFVLQDGQRKDVQGVVKDEAEGPRLHLFSRDAGADAGEAWKGHADLGLRRLEDFGALDAAGFNPAEVAGRLPHNRSGEDFYATCEAIGYVYQNRHRTVQHLWWDEREALSQVVVSPGDERYTADPGALDAIIQIFIATHIGDRSPEAIDAVIVPVNVQRLIIERPLEGELWVHFTIHDWSEERRTGTMIVQDTEGNVVARVVGITAAKVSAEALKRSAAVGLDHMLWATEWRPAPKAQAGEAGQVVLLLGHDADGGTAGALAERLKGAGQTVVRVRPGTAFSAEDGGFRVRPAAPADYAQLLDAVVEAHGRVDAAACAWALAHGTMAHDAEGLSAQQAEALGGAFHLLQALSAKGLQARVTLVTRESFAIDGSERGIALPGAGVYGFGNAAQLEFESQFPVLRVDLGAGGEDELDGLAAEITGGDTLSRVALRGADRYSAKLVPLRQAEEARERMAFPDGPNWQLDITSRGILDNLYYKAVPAEAPAPGQVQIRVHATGLNFRDVLNALGQYPGDAGEFGLECAGVVTAVGEGVTRLKVGDRVMANANGSFRRLINYAAEYVTHIPEGVSYEDAVTIPGPFLTAWYGLVRKGGLKKGDKVLIHAGAGGVGMAAVQIALAAGAEVFATASPPKQAFLRELGVHHVHNSRTLDFADEITGITGGKGVDLILNSLAGDFIRRSFDVLADHGRFVEMGKMNIWTTEQVRKFNDTLAYHAFDLAADGAEDPALIEAMFAELKTEFEAGRLQPLPKTVFDVDRTVDAFRYMAQARHIGKIVISQASAVRRERFAERGLCVADGTYVLTGGLGALGLVFADWLIENGARHLALFGRSKPKPAAQKKLDEWADKGVIARVFAADASDRASLAGVFGQIREDMPPIRGVLHLAGYLDDGMIPSTDWERFEGVLKPKIHGGWYLHELTADLDLDLFLMFSSVAAILGNRGQGNYAAANGWLDALVHWRRGQGLAGTTVNWGPWGEVGMATDAKRAELIAKAGFHNIALADGLEAVQQLLADDVAQASVVELNLPVYIGNRSEAEKAGFYEDLAARLERRGSGSPEAAQAAAGPAKTDFWVDLARAGEADRPAVMAGLVKQSVAAVLNFKNTDDIDENRQFRDLGFDSLTNAEFINHLDKTLQAGLSQSLYMEFPTVRQLSAHLVTMPSIADKLADVEVPEEGPSAEGPAPATAPSAPTAPAAPKVPAAAASGNGRAKAGNGAATDTPLESVGEGGLSYTSPVKDLGDAQAIEAQTDRMLAEQLSGRRAGAEGERRGWWKRLLDALQDIES